MIKTLILIIFSYTALVAASPPASSITKTPQPWAPEWTADFTETMYLPALGVMQSDGKWWYSFAQKRFRVDRDDGRNDRYCGSVYKLENTRCSQIVRDGKRYLHFPQKKFCCKCCTDAQGCGVVDPEFVESGEFSETTTDKNGRSVDKYLIKGMQNNWYSETTGDHSHPAEFYQDPLSDMVWRNYSPKAIDETVFDLPTDSGDCEQSCGWLTVCNALQTSNALQTTFTSARLLWSATKWEKTGSGDADHPEGTEVFV